MIKTEDIHEDFRLWITAEPHPNFPIGLLQMGIKITNEAPVGMKAGLRASYQWVTQVSGLPVPSLQPDYTVVSLQKSFRDVALTGVHCLLRSVRAVTFHSICMSVMQYKHCQFN